MERVNKEIESLETMLESMDQQLKKAFNEWTQEDKNMYGDNEQEARKYLREERKQLRELLVLKEKEKLNLATKEQQLQSDIVIDNLSVNEESLTVNQKTANDDDDDRTGPITQVFNDIEEILSQPPCRIVETTSSSKRAQIALEPLIIFGLFSSAIINMLGFIGDPSSWLSCLFLVISSIGIIAVILQLPFVLGFFFWTRMIAVIIECALFVVAFVSWPGENDIVGFVFGLLIMFFSETFVFYAINKYWNWMVDDQTLAIDPEELTPLVDPFQGE